MNPDTSYKTAVAVAVALPLLFASCHRQRVEPQPPVTEQKDTNTTYPMAAAGTSGKDATPVSQDSAAAETASATAAAASASGAAPDAVSERDPGALRALEEMGNYLRTLRAFQIHSQTSRDEVLEDGQNVAYDGVVDMLVERPNRLRAEVTSDKQQRMYFDDGRTFNVWAPRVNYYATIPAPPTLRELADKLADKYDLELPVADLFYWGDRKSRSDLTGATDLGASQVDGVTCQHYGFRQEGADWQVWIQEGDYPLPLKLIITTTTDAARPRFTSVMTWNLAPSFNDAAFTFAPPKDAKRIMLAEAPASGSQH